MFKLKKLNYLCIGSCRHSLSIAAISSLATYVLPLSGKDFLFNTIRVLLAECFKGLTRPYDLLCNVVFSKVIHATNEGKQTTQTNPLYTQKVGELSSLPYFLWHKERQFTRLPVMGNNAVFLKPLTAIGI